MVNDFSLQSLFGVAGRTALVTGGSSGLGLLMAQGLLENGARVYISSRSADKCQQAVEKLRLYGDCIAIPANVAVAADRKRLIETLSTHEPDTGLSILINNAGTNWGAKLEEYPDEGFAKVMNTNVNAVFSLTRDLVPLLEKAASPEYPARVINIGSMDGLQVPVVQRVPTFAYSTSKAALHHLTRVMAVDLAPRHITVNAIAPGFFESRMTDHVLENYRKDIEAESPMGRIGKPAEIVGIAVYLASPAAAYVNGAVIPVDGGSSISKGAKPWAL